MMGVSRGYGPASTNEDCRSNGLALPHRWEYYPPTNSFMVTFFSTASLRPYTVSYLTPTPMIEFVSFRLYSHRPRCRSECREVGLRPGTKIPRPSVKNQVCNMNILCRLQEKSFSRIPWGMPLTP